MINETRKVAIIGMGNVGSTAAYALLLQGLVDDLVLFARNKEKAIGEKLDLEHGLAFLNRANITATDDYADIKDCDIVVITAGAAQEPGESRLDLAAKNTAIMADIIPQIVKHAPSAIIVMVTNPVDILTYKGSMVAALPKGRIFGSGTMLDTARFRFHLSELLDINPRSIHAYILGEHGESSFPALSSASVGGQPLTSFPAYSKEQALEAFTKARTAAANIIEAKGATYYAIGVVIAKLVHTILHDSKSVLPVSIPVENYYGEYNVALSVPCIIGRNGVEQILNANLDTEEQAKFAASAATLRKFL